MRNRGLCVLLYLLVCFTATAVTPQFWENFTQEDLLKGTLTRVSLSSDGKLFLAPGYYYEDYWRMGLEGPPWGYRWVRYGPDLLLVDTRTGRIDDAIYGAFY